MMRGTRSSWGTLTDTRVPKISYATTCVPSAGGRELIAPSRARSGSVRERPARDVQERLRGGVRLPAVPLDDDRGRSGPPDGGHAFGGSLTSPRCVGEEREHPLGGRSTLRAE